jgi:hypothetical protein
LFLPGFTLSRQIDDKRHQPIQTANSFDSFTRAKSTPVTNNHRRLPIKQEQIPTGVNALSALLRQQQQLSIDC